MNVKSLLKALAVHLHTSPWTVAFASLVAAVVLAVVLCWGVQRLYRKTVRWMRRVGSGPIDSAARQRIRAALASNWSVGVGLVAMSVSMFNLFRWSHSHLGLPVPMAAGFTTAIDGANVGLILGLYWRSSVQRPQEHAIRTIRRMIWSLVAVSSAANWAEAPDNDLARIAMALIPIIGAGLIELNLAAERAEARAARGEGHVDDGVAGPKRLVVVLWQQLWTSIFAWLGLDANATGSERERVMLAQRAARASYELRLHMARCQELGTGRWERRRAQHRRFSLEKAQQRALARAGIANDADQALAYAREMYLLTQGTVLAGLDYSDPATVITTLEDMRIELSADRIAAGIQAAKSQERAAEAERRAKEAAEKLAPLLDAIEQNRGDLEAKKAELARVEETCETLQARAEELQNAAGAAHALWERENAAAKAAEQERIRIEGERDAAREELTNIGLLGEGARKAEQGARTRARQLLDDAEQKLSEAQTARQDMENARQQLEADQAALARARDELDAARAELDSRRTEAADQVERAKAARVQHEGARDALAAEVQAAENRMAELAEEIRAAEAQVAALGDAREDAAAQARTADELREQAERLQQTIADLEAEQSTREDEVAAVRQRHAEALEGQEQVQEALGLVEAAGSRLEGLTRAAGALVARLAGEGQAYMAERTSGYVPQMSADGQPEWRTEDRARGWQAYWDTLTTTGVELDAKALSRVCGVAEGGRARAWLTDYRTAALDLLNRHLVGVQEELTQADRALPRGIRALAESTDEAGAGIRALEPGQETVPAAIRAAESAARAPELAAEDEISPIRAGELATRAPGGEGLEDQPEIRAGIGSPRAAARVLAGIGSGGE